MARARSVSAKQCPGWNETWARHAYGKTATELMRRAPAGSVGEPEQQRLGLVVGVDLDLEPLALRVVA